MHLGRDTEDQKATDRITLIKQAIPTESKLYSHVEMTITKALMLLINKKYDKDN
jgi:hypothetical protein